MRCFVAMAFGRPDVDAVFDDLIVRAVKQACGTMPRRVDRIEHNDEIHQRIFAEIDSSDFVIADLTYSRPSVYFEAGYAQKTIPVIYTARRDHLERDTVRRDPEGLLRVHFDVQMKNIIAWDHESDATFRTRLGRRIKQVIAPLTHAKEIKEVAAEEERRFRSLPLKARLNTFRKLVTETLGTLGYSKVDERQFNSIQHSSSRFPQHDIVYFGKLSHGVLEVVGIFVSGTITQSELIGLQQAPSRSRINLNLFGVRPIAVRLSFVVCSPQPISAHKVEGVFTEFDHLRGDLVFSTVDRISLPPSEFFAESARVWSGGRSGSFEVRHWRGTGGRLILDAGVYKWDDSDRPRVPKDMTFASTSIDVAREYTFLGSLTTPAVLAERLANLRL